MSVHFSLSLYLYMCSRYNIHGPSGSRAPMECDLFCVNNMPFFLFFSFPCGNRKIYIFLKPKNIPLLFLGPPLFSTVGRFPFFFTTPSAQCLTFHEEKFVHHVCRWKRRSFSSERWEDKEGYVLGFFAGREGVFQRGLNSRESLFFFL